MNHGFESQVNLPSSDDLRDIARVVRLQKSNLDPLVLEESLGLGQVQRSVIRRGVPFVRNISLRSVTHIQKRKGQANQFVKKVILSEDMVMALLLFSQYFPFFGHPRGLGEGSMFLSQQLC
jgi:hypothetical protein